MAVRVPRVAVEAAAALLLIGAGCFMLLDLSNKQSSTFVAKGALFSSKLEGKFQQLATAIPAAIPTPCTTAVATLTGITGVCNIVNGKSGCCTNDALNAQLLPDLSNCTTRCQSYYVAFYCFYKCSGKQANLPANPICTDPLRTLFAACNTATCQVLNTGARVDTDTDYNAFIAANSITTATTAQGCNDFTSFGRRCEETAEPTIRNIQATYADDNTNVTAFPNGRPFAAVASPAAVGSITGVTVDVCVQVLNPRPSGCDTQAADQVLFPLSVNIVVEATGAGIAPYVVANAVVASQQIESVAATATAPALFRACLRGLRILPINVGVYNLAISATATNTFGVGRSANLSPNVNSLSITIPAPTGTGLSATAYTITGAINICNGNAGDSQTTGFLLGTNAFSVAPTTVVATFDTINCCEGRTDGATQQNDGLRAECNFNAAQGQAVSVATFNANPVATTIRGATLTIRTLFEAAGSITLINAGIVISSGANFRVQNAGTLLGQVALRGASGTSLTIQNGATLTLVGTVNSAVANRASRGFLITLGQVEIIAQTGSAITATNSDLVVAESSRLTVVGATITLNTDSRVVQYTDTVGGVNITTLPDTLNGVAPRQVVVTSPIPGNGGLVAVAGTFLAFAPFTTSALTSAQADLRRVIFNANTRISRSRGPDALAAAAADSFNDNTAVPFDAQIPGQPVTSFQQTTTAKFAEQIATPVNSRATLNLCGTENLSGSTITIPATGTLLVQPPSGVTRCLVPNSSPAASLITDNLNVEAGGQVTITNVDRQFNPIRINNAFTIANGASIVVFLAAGIDTTAFTGLNLFSFPAGSTAATAFCNALPVVEFRNAGNRVVTPTCNPATGTLSLAFTAVQATAPPQANPSLYTSTNEYCLLVRQDLTTFDRSSFLNAIDANFASAGTNRNLVTVTTLTTDSTNSNNLRIVFRCYDYSSVSNADVRCQNILNTASNTNSGFAQQTLSNGFCGSSAVFPTGNRNESNHGLYGLFGLVAIPIILALLIFLLVRNSRRRADNQYMQDAATFSNVASGPQPLATAVPSVQYDVAKEIYPVVQPNYPAY